jgi:hypothetical protein
VHLFFLLLQPGPQPAALGAHQRVHLRALRHSSDTSASATDADAVTAGREQSVAVVDADANTLIFSNNPS